VSLEAAEHSRNRNVTATIPVYAAKLALVNRLFEAVFSAAHETSPAGLAGDAGSRKALHGMGKDGMLARPVGLAGMLDIVRDAGIVAGSRQSAGGV
jgi:hypothetical protein